MTPGEIEAINRDHTNLKGLNEINVSLLDMERQQIDRLRSALVRLKEVRYSHACGDSSPT